MAMLDGTPGIGKSLFIFYFIYAVVNQAIEKGEHIPTFLIADRDGRSNPSFTTQYIHVSSINNVNVKDVRKLMDQRQRPNKKTRQTIWFAGFSLVEYLEIDCVGEASKVSIFMRYKRTRLYLMCVICV
jgi:hypothetical protein